MVNEEGSLPYPESPTVDRILSQMKSSPRHEFQFT